MMFKDEVLEKIYGNPKTRRVPVLFVMECIKVLEESLKEIKEEKPYVSVSELFDE